MPCLTPHQLERGMIFGEDVYGFHGQRLFKQGEELTERKIDILFMWGVESVSIEGADRDETPQQNDAYPPTISSKAERLISNTFQLVRSKHPVVEMTRAHAIAYLSKRMSENGENA